MGRFHEGCDLLFSYIVEEDAGSYGHEGVSLLLVDDTLDTSLKGVRERLSPAQLDRAAEASRQLAEQYREIPVWTDPGQTMRSN